MALRRVFTYLGAVFLMSYIIFCNNVGAVDTIIDLTNYDVVDSSTILKINSTYINGNTGATTDCVDSWSCAAPNSSTNKNWTIRNLYSTTFFNNQIGDIVEFDIILYTPTNWSNLIGFSWFSPSLSSNEWDILSVSQTINNSFYNNYSTILNGTTDTQVQGSTYNTVYHYTLRAKNNAALPIGWRYNGNIFSYTATDSIRYALGSYVRYRVRGDGSSKDQENEINATNDSVQESQTEGSSSQTDAESGSASLISTIGSAVSAITSASPTNCLLNGNMGNFDMGQIDLCANPVPAFVQIISSLILILITVPLCIVLFNRFIGLFRSFQG